MSEYWKSTPKYWCKHCKTFVKDTKFEKTNHEATPKHQGNLKRFLRDLHKGHERDERDKQRAKDEVDRLNGVVSGAGSKAAKNPWEKKPAIPTSSAMRQATPTDRKKQLAQLAELGVAVPEDFRKEMAMVGDWQITSERPIYETLAKEEDSRDVKPEGLAIGMKKRKFEGQEEEEEAGETVIRKGWGSTIRTYPGTTDNDQDDLDILLNNTKTWKKSEGEVKPSAVDPAAERAVESNAPTGSDASDVSPLKREVSSITGVSNTMLGHNDSNVAIKNEDGTMEPGVLFKKRKAKPIRQK